ncbi:hypothetical protein [Streptococcus ruminantium]|uniref:hypothetical protein n=1 Tax=Streptococcus ruminantium TaxID=1917441 RepID=UPI0012DD28F2|nr:hypothetical protein [Streptococcus ruminantium]
MGIAAVAWSSTVAQVDEATKRLDHTIRRKAYPATNLPEAQPALVTEQTDSLIQPNTQTVPHDMVIQVLARTFMAVNVIDYGQWDSNQSFIFKKVMT